MNENEMIAYLFEMVNHLCIKENCFSCYNNKEKGGSCDPNKIKEIENYLKKDNILKNAHCYLCGNKVDEEGFIDSFYPYYTTGNVCSKCKSLKSISSNNKLEI